MKEEEERWSEMVGEKRIGEQEGRGGRLGIRLCRRYWCTHSFRVQSWDPGES